MEGMVARVGVDSLDQLMEETVPQGIRARGPLAIAPSRGEHELIGELRASMAKNQVRRSMIGLGYSDCIVPPVIQRNVLENPAWYTQYTPYQAEISQGRLEALLNFQTVIADLTGLPLAGASLLDEGTAAAEAMAMCWGIQRKKADVFFVSDRVHPQTLAVLRTRADAVGIEVRVGDVEAANLDGVFGALVQYPDTTGAVTDFAGFAERLHESGGMLVVAADLLALTLLTPPGEFGADVAIGSAQRFGVPLGYGGPHAAFLATRDQYKRAMPGRLIGISRDAQGNPALRMALQTREQHIRRDKATSNICTAQVLLAIMAGMYAVYHGREGLVEIARRTHTWTAALRAGLTELGYELGSAPCFDTLSVRVSLARGKELVADARLRGLSLRPTAYGPADEPSVGISLDETTTAADVAALLSSFSPAGVEVSEAHALELASMAPVGFGAPFERVSDFLTHPTFTRYRSEHELLRYIHRLAARDLSLVTSMIPLGSCTMKLNATSEMVPVSWPEVGGLHPFAPLEDAQGYAEMLASLEHDLCEITGFAACSLQPNAGSQGELAGMLVIRAYHAANDGGERRVCLIPVSAHGTNPASAVMAGMRVVPVACDGYGNVDVDDLRAKADQHADDLAALMVTYPSTHGVFEPEIREICDIVHQHGGQVYMDGANMNAQVGLCRPGDFGADVCHLNLHKTFCIPHGGGGPGMGPICCAEHLAPFLPGHPLVEVGGPQAIGPISAAPWGSASILPISWVYIQMMGGTGLKQATEVAILNANYMAAILGEHFPVLYRGVGGRVGHEFILDLREFEKSAGVVSEDVAKRLMDYGFHAPTMSFPVTGTLMIEPTESESREELDRFCAAMVSIREEIRAIEEGRMDRDDNPLKNAPHTAHVVCADTWPHGYSRDQAAFPAPWTRDSKFWPSVGRIDNGYGDKNLICSCPPMEEYADGEAEESAPPRTPQPA